MGTQIRYSLTPTWKPPAPVLEYPAPPLESAALWDPPILEVDCIVLGFPWGAWSEGAAEQELLAPDQVSGPLTGLLSSFPLFDSNLLQWAATPGHTLICLVPPPPSVPIEEYSRVDVYTTLGRDSMLHALGKRVRLLLSDELPRSAAALRPSSPGWWDFYEPLDTGDRFHLDALLPRALTGKAPKHRRSSQLTISGHRILGASSDFPTIGPAIDANVGGARVVFLLSKHPNSPEGVAAMERVAGALHAEARREPSTPRAQVVPQDVTPTGTTPPAPDLAGTITLVELHELIQLLKPEWTEMSYNAARRRIKRGKTPLFAGLRKHQLEGKHAPFDRAKVMTVLTPYLDKAEAFWDDATKERVKIQHLRDSKAGYLATHRPSTGRDRPE